jgi:hypothetical protein
MDDNHELIIMGTWGAPDEAGAEHWHPTLARPATDGAWHHVLMESPVLARTGRRTSPSSRTSCR